MTDPPSLASCSRFALGDFRLDVARYRLSRGQREIPLPPKAWDVLYCLIKRPGLLVTKEALRHEIWPDIAISDDTLTKRIGKLRRALGDSEPGISTGSSTRYPTTRRARSGTWPSAWCSSTPTR
jgi:DNA-binding winged helix-turn-helix (wHTH) protein